MITKWRYTPGDREEWLALRNRLKEEGRIGGSSVGTAAGVNPWKSPLRLWAEMSGLLEDPDISNKPRVRYGQDLEEYVAQRFAEASGKRVHRENCIMTNDKYPHLMASIDRKIENEDSGLECKTASEFRAGAFTNDSFPPEYYAQCLDYLAVTELKRWYLAVMIGPFLKIYLITTDPADMSGEKPEWLTYRMLVEKDEIERAEEIAANFIGLVRSGVRPEPTGSDDELAAAKEIFPPNDATPVALGNDTIALFEERKSLKTQIDMIENNIKAVEAQIVQALGGHMEGYAGGWKVTYKTQTTRRINSAKIKTLGLGDEFYTISESPAMRITAPKN